MQQMKRSADLFSNFYYSWLTYVRVTSHASYTAENRLFFPPRVPLTGGLQKYEQIDFHTTVVSLLQRT